MTSTLVGQRFNDGSGTASQYRKHPPTGYALDGDAMDAGTWMEFDQNLSHLCAESYRHLWWNAGPGDNLDVKGGGTQWTGLSDAAAPSPGETTDAMHEIPWRNGLYAWRAGPFFGVCDQDVTGGYSLRKVQWFIEYSGATAFNSIVLYVAMTPSAAPPTDSFYDGTFFKKVDPFGSGYRTWSPLMAPTSPRIPLLGSERRCRPDGDPTTVSRRIVAPEFYLWLAWNAGNAADKLISVSAFEVP